MLYKIVHFLSPRRCLKSCEWNADEELDKLAAVLTCKKCKEVMAYSYRDTVFKKLHIRALPDYEEYIEEIKESYYESEGSQEREFGDDVWGREWKCDALLNLEPREDDVLPLQDNGGEFDEDWEGEDPDRG